MRNKVVIAVIAASAGWGLAGVGTRAAYSAGATTLSVLSIRTVVATAALAFTVFVTHTRPSGLAWWHGSLIGTLRIGVTPLLFMLSLNYISAGVEGLVITLVPAATAVLAAIFIQERITGRQIAGLIIGLAGTLLIALAGDSGLGAEGDIVAGFGFAVGGVLVGSTTGVMQRHYAPRHDTVELALPMFLSGTVVAITFGAVIGFDSVRTYDADLWLLLIVLGLGSTLLPFGLTLYASKHATATVVAMTAYVAPLIAVIGGAVLLDEQITAVIAIGGLVAVVGVALVGTARRTQT
ncbi:MAG: hypothetical protein BMS9Abin20_1394 [Acidimicrobiia bacterium]|nr:MAG: hypothetical protein BMS9Abin20_1394 [Acidimicrobiia bacterium]